MILSENVLFLGVEGARASQKQAKKSRFLCFGTSFWQNDELYTENFEHFLLWKTPASREEELRKQGLVVHCLKSQNM